MGPAGNIIGLDINDEALKRCREKVKFEHEGANGIVFAGTKFYMVGTIEVTTGHTGDEDYMNRVFTKDRVTRGIVNISSLKQAYTYLPDLLDPRLEIGIKLVPEWIQATTTNVAL